MYVIIFTYLDLQVGVPFLNPFGMVKGDTLTTEPFGTPT